GDALAQWQAAVAERPAFAPAWAGLGRLALAQQRWADLDEAVAHLRANPAAAGEAVLLEANGRRGRGGVAEARPPLEECIAADGQALPARVLLTHVLLQEGRDPTAAERALRDVLTRASTEAESWRNLAVLLRHQGRMGEAAVACRSGLVHCPDDPRLLLLYGCLLHEQGDLTTLRERSWYGRWSCCPWMRGRATRWWQRGSTWRKSLTPKAAWRKQTCSGKRCWQSDPSWCPDQRGLLWIADNKALDATIDATPWELAVWQSRSVSPYAVSVF